MKLSQSKSEDKLSKMQGSFKSLKKEQEGSEGENNNK